MLDFARPIYQKTAAYGHFGRKEEEFTWERTDKARRARRRAQSNARGVAHPRSRQMNAAMKINHPNRASRT